MSGRIGHSSFGNSNTWSVLLPVQSPATDIYVTFNGIYESCGYPVEVYSHLEAGIFKLGWLYNDNRLGIGCKRRHCHRTR